MITEFLLDLSEYLNNEGFSITEERLIRLMSQMGKAGVGLKDADKFLSIARLTLTTDPKEYNEIADRYRHFLENREKIREAALDAARSKEEIAKLKARSETERKDHEAKVRSIKTDIEEAQRRREDAISRIKKEQREKNNAITLSKNTERLLAKEEAQIKRIRFSDGKMGQLLIKCLYERKPEEYRHVTEIAKELVRMSEGCILSGKADALAKVTLYRKLIDALNEIAAALEEQRLREEAETEEQDRKEWLEMNMLQCKLAAEEADHRKRQAKINEAISNLEAFRASRDITKDVPVTHRPEFIGGHNAVKAHDIEPIADKTFTALTEEEKRTLSRYIKDNLVKFRTVMKRRIETGNVHDIDMEETIKNACRTGSVPFKIAYKQPVRNKANLILFLDVSGSCSNASATMLTFAGIMQETFPRGCKAFAFVNQLYDISGIFSRSKAGNIDRAVEQALEQIPRRGVYSDYHVPLKDIWENRRTMITKDSIVIFMGDARNNKNPPGTEYIKNIVRRAKQAYFLNTESRDSWGVSDSLAVEYGRYIRMYETLTVGDLIRFIHTSLMAGRSCQ